MYKCHDSDYEGLTIRLIGRLPDWLTDLDMTEWKENYRKDMASSKEQPVKGHFNVPQLHRKASSCVSLSACYEAPWRTDGLTDWRTVTNCSRHLQTWNSVLPKTGWSVEYHMGLTWGYPAFALHMGRSHSTVGWSVHTHRHPHTHLQHRFMHQIAMLSLLSLTSKQKSEFKWIEWNPLKIP